MLIIFLIFLCLNLDFQLLAKFRPRLGRVMISSLSQLSMPKQRLSAFGEIGKQAEKGKDTGIERFYRLKLKLKSNNLNAGTASDLHLPLLKFICLKLRLRRRRGRRMHTERCLTTNKTTQ